MARNNAKTPDLIKDYASYLGYIRGENGYNHWTTSGSSKGLYSGQLDLEKYYNVESETVNIKELLTDVFVVIVPEQNVEGYEHMTRTTGQGYDPNRDEANQTLFEDANAMALVNKFNPMVFIPSVHDGGAGGYRHRRAQPHSPKTSRRNAAGFGGSHIDAALRPLL